jgi:hypothetical protein
MAAVAPEPEGPWVAGFDQRSNAGRSAGGRSHRSGQSHRSGKKVAESTVPFSKFEEFLVIEKGVRESCQTLPFTLVLWIFFILITWLHGYIETSFEARMGVAHELETTELPYIVNGSQKMLMLGNLRNQHEIWYWIKHGLVPVVSKEGPSHGNIQQYNKMIGNVRMEQTRSGSETCDLGKDLKKFYDGPCHPMSSESKAPYGDHERDMAFRPGGDMAGEDPYTFNAWLDIGRSIEHVQERVQILHDMDWLDVQSKALTIEGMFFNAEVRIYTLLRIKFEFQRGGWIEQKMEVRPMRADIYPHWAYVLPDVVWVGLLLVLFRQEVVQVREDAQRKTLSIYFHDLWNWLDWASILLGFWICIFFWILVSQLGYTSDLVVKLGHMPPQAVWEVKVEQRRRVEFENLDYQEKVARLLWYASAIATAKVQHRLCMFWYSLIIMLRFFKAFTGQPRIAVISHTLKLATMDLVHFAIIFLVIFANFTLGGYILFGEQLHEWSELGRAVHSTFEMTLGNFAYARLHSVASVSAAIWFWVYVVLVLFVLINVLIAIIMDHYLMVKSRIGEVGVGIWSQVVGMIQDFKWAHSYEGSKKTVPIDSLLVAMTGDSNLAHHRSVIGFKMNRRPRNAEDILRIHTEPQVTVDFLVANGCDHINAARLIAKCKASLVEDLRDDNPLDRLNMLVNVETYKLKDRAEKLETQVDKVLDTLDDAVDRIDLKQKKCIGLAKRIEAAQKLPDGWREIIDEDGQKFYYHEKSGQSYGTLPRSGAGGQIPTGSTVS